MRTESWSSDNSRESDTLNKTWDRQEGALTASKNISVEKFMFQMICYHVGVNGSHRWNVTVTAFVIFTEAPRERWHSRAQQNIRRRLTILPTEHDGKQILALCQTWGESSPSPFLTRLSGHSCHTVTWILSVRRVGRCLNCCTIDLLYSHHNQQHQPSTEGKTI